jgi:endonuclease III
MAPAQGTSSQGLRRSKRLSAQGHAISASQASIGAPFSQLPRPAQSKVKKSRASNKDKAKAKAKQALLTQGQKHLSSFFARNTKVSTTISIDDGSAKVGVQHTGSTSFTSTRNDDNEHAEDVGTADLSKTEAETKVQVTSITKKRNLAEDSDIEFTPEEHRSKSRAVTGVFHPDNFESVVQTRTRAARISYDQFFPKEESPALTKDKETPAPEEVAGLLTREPKDEDATTQATQVKVDSEVQPSQAVNELPSLGNSQPVNVITSAHITTTTTNTTSVTVKTPAAEITINSKKKRNVIRAPEGGWDNKKYRFSFNYTPFPDHNKPTHDDARAVYKILEDDLEKRSIAAGDKERGNGPAHGQEQNLTVDHIVRVYMAQATNNETALAVQSLLRKTATFTVNGKKVIGKVPNYHRVRLWSQEKLKGIVATGGFYEARSSNILACLDRIYQLNCSMLPSLEGVEKGQVPNTGVFVPGLLSLSFMYDWDMKKAMDWLLALPGYGVKSAFCILEFNLGFNLCAVDTHVLNMAAALRWIPEEIYEKADPACMHLDVRLPIDLKHKLHQAVWNHRRLCKACSTPAEEEVKPEDAAQCPFSEILKRVRTKKKASRPKREAKEKVEKADGEEKVVMKKGYKSGGAEKVVKEKKLSAFLKWDKFDSVGEAAQAGYEPLEIDVDDDFAAGSVNQEVKCKWVLKSLVVDDDE